MKKLFFIGGGKMASAIAGGLTGTGTFEAAELGAFDPDENAAGRFTAATGVAACTDSPESGIRDAEAVLVAVKPQVIAKALEKHRELLRGKLIISIVAGVSIGRLHELTGSDRIIRVMPNTPALVGKGAAAYAVAAAVSAEEELLTQKIFSSVGIAVKLKEADLDAVTALSGSGPAYAFEFAQAMADGGVAEGLPRDVAIRLAAQTMLGAAEMILSTGEHPAVLKDKVTSPAGTTARALEELAARGFAGSIIKAVRAAAARSRELGKC